jgi:hypothetical protein
MAASNAGCGPRQAKPKFESKSNGLRDRAGEHAVVHDAIAHQQQGSKTDPANGHIRSGRVLRYAVAG